MKSLMPSDTKLAESAHLNVTRAVLKRGEQVEELKEDEHADAQTGGPGNVLSMFL